MNYYLDRIQRGVDHIEQTLDESIALSDVARAAGMSQWHFQRMFKALTGETLKTYIRSRRLARSLDRLLTTKLRVLDIALLAGFESQESFARAFKKAFDLTPQEYRKLGDKSLFLKKVEFTPQYLEHVNRGVSLTPEIVEWKPRALVGLRTLLFGVDSEKNNVAEKLPPLWAAFLPRLEEIADRIPGVCYGVLRQEKADSERLEYHAAIEVNGDVPLPVGMEKVRVPAGKYAVFRHEGRAELLDHTVNYVYSTWLAQSGQRHSYGSDLEIYGPGYHPTSENSVISYAVPVH